MAGKAQIAALGEEITVPIGVAHSWWNSGEDEASVRVELRPALDTETFFETFFGLARDDKMTAKGIPGLLQIAALFSGLGNSCPFWSSRRSSFSEACSRC